MGLVLFYWTLLVMLFSMVASATCLSAYLVSRKRTMLFLFVGFLFYFFDVAFVFQDEYALHILGMEFNGVYAVLRSLVLVVTGAGVLTSFWLAVGDYLGEKSRALLIGPCAVFVVASLVLLLVPPESDVQRFWFYTMRALYAYWIVGFVLVRYFTSGSEIVRGRLRRRLGLLAVAVVLISCVVAEDALFFLVLHTNTLQIGPFQLSGERNYAENLLMLCVGVAAFCGAWKTLNLRSERPPSGSDQRHEREIAETLLVYAKRNGLSERERQVLYEVLLGKDNQNIASEMSLALSTVKVHVHNILQKTGNANRQELVQDFWKMS